MNKSRENHVSLKRFSRTGGLTEFCNHREALLLKINNYEKTYQYFFKK